MSAATTDGPLILTGLYVPGNRPERFAKAVASGADLVILDLEDSVPSAEKVEARLNVVEWLRTKDNDAATDRSGPRIQVRVTAGSDEDLDALLPVADRFALRLPKAENAAQLDSVAGFSQVTALIETALGIERAFALAEHPVTAGLALGDSDLASDLGASSQQVIDFARIRLVVASRAAALPPPMVSAWPGITDLDGLLSDTRRGASMGLIGRVAIHPVQLPVIRSAFLPNSADISWASEVIEALLAGGVTTLRSGAMVDAAMRGRAERILRLAEATHP
ncbi:CoA ester lyase [Cryobacterium sp. Hh11]|uniref:HpcH/HpaI aldolase/citrate lyase family protein n=1 Tax=Cryobacterium sp. Hh11 TaxID=2555868 RepID=UPI00141BF4BB|nr:CoA ester lyase [Cryobacterium sp. Hh11]